MSDLMNVEDSANNEIVDFKIKSNVYYEDLWIQKLGSYLSNLAGIGLNNINALLPLTNPSYICNEIYNAIEYLFKRIYLERDVNYIEGHKAFLDAIIFDEIMFDSIDNFTSFYNKLNETVNATQEAISDESSSFSWGGLLLESTAHVMQSNSYREKGRASFRAGMMAGLAQQMHLAAENQKMANINALEQQMYDEIMRLLNQEVIAEIQNIFNRTVQILPFLANAIAKDNLFLILTERENAYKPESLKKAETDILNNFDKSTLLTLSGEYFMNYKANIADYLISSSMFDGEESFEFIYSKASIKFYLAHSPIYTEEARANFLKEALEYSTKAYLLNPEPKEVLDLYARVLAESGIYDEAIKVTDMLIAKFPDSLEYYQDKYIYLANAEKYKESYQELLKLTKKFGLEKEKQEELQFLKEKAEISNKNWVVLFILALMPPFYKFYAGQPIRAIMFWIVSTICILISGPMDSMYPALIPVAWWGLDFIKILTNKFKDRNGYYITR